MLKFFGALLTQESEDSSMAAPQGFSDFKELISDVIDVDCISAFRCCHCSAAWLLVLDRNNDVD
jgi:hypothetical protein